MADYAILRFSKRKAGGVASTDRHNERKKSVYKSNPDIDMERSKNNYHLVKPDGTYSSVYKKMIAEAGCRTRSNSTVMVETLITASPDYISEMSSDEQRQFFERAADFICEKIRKQNIISAVVHMDEKTPHMHLTFCPITEDGRLSAKDILGNKAQLSRWQDEFYAYMVQYYPEISRGLPSYITHRKHIPTYLFKQAKDLEQIYPKLLESLDNINAFNAGKKREEAISFIGTHMPTLTKLTAQLTMTDEYIKELEKSKGKLEEAIASRDLTIGDMEEEIFALEYKVSQLNNSQRKAQELLDRIPTDVMESITKKQERNYER